MVRTFLALLVLVNLHGIAFGDEPSAGDRAMAATATGIAAGLGAWSLAARAVGDPEQGLDAYGNPLAVGIGIGGAALGALAGYVVIETRGERDVLVGTTGGYLLIGAGMAGMLLHSKTHDWHTSNPEDEFYAATITGIPLLALEGMVLGMLAALPAHRAQASTIAVTPRMMTWTVGF